MQAIYPAVGACLGVCCTVRGLCRRSGHVAVRHRLCVYDSHALQRCTHVNVLLADDDAERAGAVARILATGPEGNAG
jgi:hypothetical protein